MTLYEILTGINMVGSLVTVYCLFKVMFCYQMGYRMGIYFMLSIGLMFLLCYNQVATLSKTSDPVTKLFAMVAWLTKLYLSWAIRFNLIKK